VRCVDQRPNLRQLCQLLGRTEGLIITAGFKKTTESVVKNRRKCQLGVSFRLRGGDLTLKPREAKVVWTPGTDNSLVLEEHRERAGMW